MKNEELISKIIQCIYNVRGELRGGYLESVYKNALIHELGLNGIKAYDEVPIKVFYKGLEVGVFKADLLVDGRVVIELKAVDTLNKIHEVQLVNYLTATGIDDGLLVNFGNDFEIKRKYRVYTPKSNT